MSPNVPVTPLALENIYPLSIDAFVQPGDNKKDEKEVPWLLEYVTSLLSLACVWNFRGATREKSFMYLDLPSNMVGSFLMGWFGVVFKRDITKVSDQLALGLTTGFLGSLTTFSGWNQGMLDLSVEGHWVFAFLCFFIGSALASLSLYLGVLTAKGCKWLYKRSNTRNFSGTSHGHACMSNRFQCLVTFMVVLLVLLVLLWGIFGALEKKSFENGGGEAQLYLACLVGPFGVWIRWLLARFNQRGFGRNGIAKWFPIGTLAANVLAACAMAALATLKKAVGTKTCETLATGIQIGLLGCLSTVSTFVAELYAMIESGHPWRASAYAAITFVISFVLGTLIYSVPVWVG